jgi:hypothetical protein
MFSQHVHNGAIRLVGASAFFSVSTALSAGAEELNAGRNSSSSTDAKIHGIQLPAC